MIGKFGLLAAALLAGGGLFEGPQIRWYDTPKNVPDDRGRRKEKDEVAMAKTEAKRRRKAEKRMPHNVQGKARE